MDFGMDGVIEMGEEVIEIGLGGDVVMLTSD
jgi:hypothetical protein